MTRYDPTHGWKAWETRRRRQIRATPGIHMSMATRFATHERRCRAAMAEITGKPFAKLAELTLCVGGEHEDPQFVLQTPVSRETWRELEKVPALLRPVQEAW